MKPAWAFVLGVALSAAVIVGAFEVRRHRTKPADAPADAPGDPLEAVAPTYPGIHEAILEAEKRDPPGVLFIGDSITDFWRTVPWLWQESFGQFHPCNAGVSFDQIQHVLWRVQHGELDGITPRVIVLLIGTNNIAIGHDEGGITGIGIGHLGGIIHNKLPDAKILLVGLLPRHDQFDGQVLECNRVLAGMATGDYAFYIDPGAQMTLEDFPDRLHPGPDGYRHLAKLLAPKIGELYGMRPTTAP